MTGIPGGSDQPPTVIAEGALARQVGTTLPVTYEGEVVGTFKVTDADGQGMFTLSDPAECRQLVTDDLALDPFSIGFEAADDNPT